MYQKKLESVSLNVGPWKEKPEEQRYPWTQSWHKSALAIETHLQALVIEVQVQRFCCKHPRSTWEEGKHDGDVSSVACRTYPKRIPTLGEMPPQRPQAKEIEYCWEKSECNRSDCLCGIYQCGRVCKLWDWYLETCWPFEYLAWNR